MASHLVPYPKPKAPQSQITILFPMKSRYGNIDSRLYFNDFDKTRQTWNVKPMFFDKTI